MSTNRVVLLLHDQLLDARVWSRFGDLLSAHAEVIVVPTLPAGRLFSRPSAWADHAEREARTQISEPVALTFATGWSVRAAASLVEDGLSRHALLVNPAPKPAALREVGPVGAGAPTQQEGQRLAPDRPGATAAPAGPHEKQIADGILDREAAEYLVDASLSGLTALGEEDRALLKQIGTDQFARLLPLSLSDVGSVDFSDEPDWVDAIAPQPERYTVALSHLPIAPVESVRALLARRVPQTRVVDLPLRTPYPWLEDPGRMDSLVRELLD
jgi:hypothetical protein